jgi:DNA primase small subunit
VAKSSILDRPTLDWARRLFGDYYNRSDVRPPSRLAKREFAAFPFGGESLMRRHATMRSPEQMMSFLRDETPRHVYYSSAYYNRPDAPNMTAKEWIGADLIFDLDSDHLRGASELDYAGQLDRVKDQLKRLLDDFLERDFGVGPDLASVVFSGGRGYHVHIDDSKFVTLTGPERREIVDYVFGVGIQPERTIRSELARGDALEFPEDGSATRGGVVYRWISPRDPGWRGRSGRGIVAAFRRWIELGRAGTASELRLLGFPPSQASDLARRFVTGGLAQKILDSEQPDGSYPLNTQDYNVSKELFERIARSAAIDAKGETDAPVTTDIHRLIRLPGSLHGGTGFRVTPLSRDELDGFNPLRDSLLSPLAESTQKVAFTSDVHYPFPDGGVRGVEGGHDELPTPVALFLILRQEAELLPSPT